MLSNIFESRNFLMLTKIIDLKMRKTGLAIESEIKCLFRILKLLLRGRGLEVEVHYVPI